MNKEDIFKILSERLKLSVIKQDEPMSKHTTFKIGGKADIFIIVNDLEELKYIMDIIHKNNIPFVTLGNGSNVLVKDDGIRGIVLKINLQKVNMEYMEDYALVTVEAGVKNGELASKLQKGGLGGFEFASSIPGTIGGAIFITVSACIITAFVFFLVRKLGRNFVYEFFDSKKIEKIENSKIFKNPKKIEWIMIILFLIPGTPKDLLVYIGGLLPLKPLRFILISTFARFPSVISSTIAGENLALGNWQMSLIVYAITFVIIGIIMLIINKFDKTNITKEAIETIK